jgi:hypothetical protein
MNAETLEALKGSIKKWESIVHDGEEDKGVDNCDLCGLFFNHDCNDCPVSDFSGHMCCHNSPHEAFCGYCFDKQKGAHPIIYKVFDDKSKELARAELDFLKSFLPEGDI